MLARNWKSIYKQRKNIQMTPGGMIGQVVVTTEIALGVAEVGVIEGGEAGTIEVEVGPSGLEEGEATADFLLIPGMTAGLVHLEKMHTNIMNEIAHKLQEDIQWEMKIEDHFLPCSKLILPQKMIIGTIITKEIEDLEENKKHRHQGEAKTFFRPESLDLHHQEDQHQGQERALPQDTIAPCTANPLESDHEDLHLEAIAEKTVELGQVKSLSLPVIPWSLHLKVTKAQKWTALDSLRQVILWKRKLKNLNLPCNHFLLHRPLHQRRPTIQLLRRQLMRMK